MKSYTLRFTKADFDSTSGSLWRTPVIDLYDNNQYRNFSVKRSSYGNNLLGNGVYTGTDQISSTETEIGFIDNGRFIDTSGRIDILAWEIDVLSTGSATGQPYAKLNVFHNNEAIDFENATPGGWAKAEGILETQDIYIISAYRYAYFELDFDTDVSLDDFEITLWLRIEIDSPVINGFFRSTGKLMGKFPQWMDINETNPRDPDFTNFATPNSLGGQVLNAIAGEWLSDVQSKIDFQRAQYFIDSADINQKAWVFRTRGVDEVVYSIEGDGIPLAHTTNMEEFHKSVDADHACFWNKNARDIFTNVRYNELRVNGVVVSQESYHVWNSIDDIGATVDLWRLRYESNTSFKARIKDVYKNRPGTSMESLKLAIRRELNLWRFEGATPDSDYVGATPNVYEMDDLRRDPLYYDDRGMPTEKFKDLVEELAMKYPIAWGYFTYGKAFWDPDGLRHEGVDFLPHLLDATPVSSEYLDSGVGDGNDLYLFRPDQYTGPTDFTTNLKIRGRRRIDRDEYLPLTFDVEVFGRGDMTVYTNSPFAGKFTIEVTTPSGVFFTIAEALATSNVDYYHANPTAESRGMIEWTTPGGLTDASFVWYNKATGVVYGGEGATPTYQIYTSNISAVSIRPGVWNPYLATPTYENVPTQSDYRLWFLDNPGSFLGAGGSSVITDASFDSTTETGILILESRKTSNSLVADSYTTSSFNYTINLNDAYPPTTPDPFVLELPSITFPPHVSNQEIIVRLNTFNANGTAGAQSADQAATPIFLNYSMIRVNGNNSWIDNVYKSFPVGTTSITFSSGTDSSYPVDIPEWVSFEASLVTPINGRVDRNGPWREDQMPPEGNTNYLLQYIENLDRTDFGIPNTSNYIITWIGVSNTSTDDVSVWLDSNTIHPAVSYGGEIGLEPEYPANAVIEELDGSIYRFSPFPLYARLRPGSNEQWYPSVHSGYFFDDTEEFYVHANPKTQTYDANSTDAGYITINNVAGNYLSSPDAAALDITGDITLVSKFKVGNFSNPGLTNYFIDKTNSGTNQISYALAEYAGYLIFAWSTTGASGSLTSLITQIPPQYEDQWMWAGVTFDVNNGFGGKTIRFWISDDGISWSKLDEQTSVGTTSIFSGTAPLSIGSSAGGAIPFFGSIAYASVRSGIGVNGTIGGTEVFRMASSNITNPNATSFVASTGQTITVNRSGSSNNLILVPYSERTTIHDLNRQGAPIITKAYVPGSTPAWKDLRQVANFELDYAATPATPSYSLYRGETRYGSGTTKIYVSYDDIYDISVINQTLGIPVALTSTSSVDNVVSFVDPTNENYEYEITYRIRDSYFVDNSNGTMKIVHDDISKYVRYQTTWESSIYNPATPINIPLNPMFTSIDEGFVFIDHDIRPLRKIELTVSPSHLTADGLDYGIVSVRTFDDVGNPKPYTNVNVYTNFGILTWKGGPATNIQTDIDGFAYLTLTSELWDGSLTPSPATPSLPAPSSGNGYAGQIAVRATNNVHIASVANYIINVPKVKTNEIVALPVSDSILADGQSANSVVGQLTTASHIPIPYMKVGWRKGRTIYQTLGQARETSFKWGIEIRDPSIGYAYIADAPGIDFTGSFVIRWFGTLSDWSGGVSGETLINKFDGVFGGLRTFMLRPQGGHIRFYISVDGTTNPVTTASGFNVPFKNNEYGGIQVTRDSTTGRITVHTSKDDGRTWQFLNSEVLASGALYDSTANLILFGGHTAGQNTAPDGVCTRVEMYSGTTIASGTPTVLFDGTGPTNNATSFVITSGHTVNLVGTTIPTLVQRKPLPAETSDFVNKRIYSSGINNEYIFVPSASVPDIAGDICIVAKLRYRTFPQAATAVIAGKWLFGQASYLLTTEATGKLGFSWTTDNVNQLSMFSTVPLPSEDWSYVAFTFDVNNGAGGKTGRFWYSDDGVNWEQLGAEVKSGGTTSIYASTSPLFIAGIWGAAGTEHVGDIYEISIRNGIGTNGTVGGNEVFGFGPENLIVGSTTFTARTGQTVTLSKSPAATPSTNQNGDLKQLGIIGDSGYVVTDVNGRFQIGPFVSSNDPGYWFVAVESRGHEATPTSFTPVGDIVSWYEYANVNDAVDPITNLPRANDQDATPHWAIPNHSYGSVYPVNWDEDDRLDVGNGATPIWKPPSWYAINRYRQYQMGLLGSNYYEVGATPPHPDQREY